MILRSALVLHFMAMALLLPASQAAAQGPITGEWTVERTASSPAKAQVDFRSDDATSTRGHWNSSFDIDVDRLGLAPSDLDSDGKHVQFTFAREAGSFTCDGWAGHGRGAGTFTFSPSVAFLDGLRKRGFADITPHKQLAAATLDLTLAYIDGIAAAGFPHPSFDKLIAFRALSVTGQSIAELRTAFGGAQLDEEQVTSLAALRVTPAYIADMRTLGVDDMSPRRAVELKALGIDRAYVDSLAKAGYPKLAAHDLVQMKALGIDEAYIRRLADHGFKNLTVAQLVRMKAVGI